MKRESPGTVNRHQAMSVRRSNASESEQSLGERVTTCPMMAELRWDTLHGKILRSHTLYDGYRWPSDRTRRRVLLSFHPSIRRRRTLPCSQLLFHSAPESGCASLQNVQVLLTSIRVPGVTDGFFPCLYFSITTFGVCDSSSPVAGFWVRGQRAIRIGSGRGLGEPGNKSNFERTLSGHCRARRSRAGQDRRGRERGIVCVRVRHGMGYIEIEMKGMNVMVGASGMR